MALTVCWNGAAVVGAPMHAPEAAVLRQYGGDPTAHRAQQLTGNLIDHSGLILALTSSHLNHITEERPSALERSFTLLEFAHILQLPEVAVLKDHTVTAYERLVAAASVLRTRVAIPEHPERLDIADPYGHGARVHTESDHAVIDAVETIAHGFGISL